MYFPYASRGDWFADYTKFGGGKVLMGNNMSCEVVSIGSMSIKLRNGIVKKLRNVRHVHDLQRNLISLGTLDELGCLYNIKGGVLKLIKRAPAVMSSHTFTDKHALYVSTYVTSTLHDPTALWHSRLGHISEKGLHVLLKQSVFDKNVINKLDFCDHCVLGKHH